MHHFTLKSFHVKAPSTTITIIPICCQYGSIVIKFHVIYYYWYSALGPVWADQSSVRRLVWLWYAASWASS